MLNLNHAFSWPGTTCKGGNGLRCKVHAAFPWPAKNKICGVCSRLGSRDEAQKAETVKCFSSAVLHLNLLLQILLISTLHVVCVQQQRVFWCWRECNNINYEQFVGLPRIKKTRKKIMLVMCINIGVEVSCWVMCSSVGRAVSLVVTTLCDN